MNPVGVFQQLAREREQKNQLMFYGFNSRMIPDSIETCKPVYRKLLPRSDDELAMLEAIEAKKKRKSAKKSGLLSKEEKKTEGKRRGRKKKVEKD